MNPIAKLEAHGLSSLSDLELLEGVVGDKALHILRDRGLAGIFRSSMGELTLEGLDRDAAYRLVAVGELHRRALVDLHRPEKFDDAKGLARFLIPRMAMESVEVVVAVYLDRDNRVLQIREVFRGGRNQVTLDPSVVLRGALACSADSFIVAHNHPSGRINPSAADDEITQKLVTQGKLVDTPLTDHLIIAGNNWYSYRDLGRVAEMGARTDTVLKELGHPLR